MAETALPPFAEQLEEALALVARESPLHFTALRRQLGDLAAVLRVGQADPVRVSVADEPPWVEHGSEGHIALALAEPGLARLLLGEMTIEEGILDGHLEAKGEVGHLLAFFDALGSWLHGALRCPSMPELHARCLATLSRAPNDDVPMTKGQRRC